MTNQFITQRMVMCLFVCVYAIVSLNLMMVFISSYISPWSLNYIQIPPYTYRVLVPVLISGVQHMMPAAVHDALTPLLLAARDSDFGNKLLFHIQDNSMDPRLSGDQIFDTFISMIVVYAFLIAFICMLYRLAVELFPESTLYAQVAPVIAMLLVVPFVTVATYVYDFAELFFSCTLLYLLYRQKWWLYLTVLLFSVMNKETTIFCILYYFFWYYDKMPRRQYVLLGVAQLVIYIIVEACILEHFTPHAGDWVAGGIGQLSDGFVSLGKDGIALSIRAKRVLFWIGYEYSTFVNFMMATLLISYRWMEKPARLRSAAWMILFNVGAYLLTCHQGEYRDLYWCLPILVLLGTDTLVKLSGLQELAIFKTNKA